MEGVGRKMRYKRREEGKREGGEGESDREKRREKSGS